MKAVLVLENGSVFEGISLGVKGTAVGEVVFNTAMSGYQEILTDPSYKGQIVTMTYPEIGNYGLNSDDEESNKPYVEGFIVKEASKVTSNFRSQNSLDDYLREHSIVGIENIDTRKITKQIRVEGSLIGAISTESDTDTLKRLVADFEIVGKDLVKYVSTKETYTFGNGIFKFGFENRKTKRIVDNKRVVVIDFGVKRNILRYLTEVGFEVIVVNAYSTYDYIKTLEPNAIFLSNGPGDPRGVDEKWIGEYRKIVESYPTFGICFGHQIILRAFGVKIYKMKFGHHGGNHPVVDLDTGKVFVTAQNHNYAADEKDSLEKGFKITYKNLNDGSVEGVKHAALPVISVQYHPEASPGPHDAEYLFEKFAAMTL